MINRRTFIGSISCAGLAAGYAFGLDDANASQTVKLGVGASLGGARVFPADNPWNQDVSESPVDQNSDALIGRIGARTPLHPDFGHAPTDGTIGIPYVIVSGTQARAPVRFKYADESDAGPYPIPADAPIEGGRDSKGDRHVVVIDRDRWKLFELFAAQREVDGWHAESGAVFDLNSNDMRPMYWTSADAAGLPIFPGLVRADEVFEQKQIRHALRFTCRKTRRAFVYPARHYASSRTDESLPPMGMRVRLKARFDASGFSPEVRIILLALKKYGMMLADNGSDWYITGAPDPRWNDARLRELKRVRGSDFEVIRMEKIVT